jgi:hypothetical protein
MGRNRIGHNVSLGSWVLVDNQFVNNYPVDYAPPLHCPILCTKRFPFAPFVVAFGNRKNNHCTIHPSPSHPAQTRLPKCQLSKKESKKTAVDIPAIKTPFSS